MKTLLESRISNEVINEFKNALIEQYKAEIEEKVAELKKHFISKGYEENEIYTEFSLSGYGETSYIRCTVKTVHGSEMFFTTSSTRFLYVHESNTKETNAAITKIASYYDARLKEDIERVKKSINELSVETVKFYPGYNDKRIMLEGLGYANSGGYYYYESSFNRGDLVLLSKEENAKLMDVISLKNAEIAAKKAVIAAEEEAIAAEKEAKKQELKAWALANGSELLKARIEENMNWVELADKEYDHSRMPEGFDYKDEDDYDSCWDYNNPTLEHINVLRESRKNEVFESVKLRKCRKTDEDGDKTFYFFIVATMLSYDGTEFEVSKLIESKFVPADEE